MNSHLITEITVVENQCWTLLKRAIELNITRTYINVRQYRLFLFDQISNDILRISVGTSKKVTSN